MDNPSWHWRSDIWAPHSPIPVWKWWLARFCHTSSKFSSVGFPMNKLIFVTVVWLIRRLSTKHMRYPCKSKNVFGFTGLWAYHSTLTTKTVLTIQKKLPEILLQKSQLLCYHCHEHCKSEAPLSSQSVIDLQTISSQSRDQHHQHQRKSHIYIPLLSLKDEWKSVMSRWGLLL